MVCTGLFALPTFSFLNLKAIPQSKHSFLKTLKSVEIKSFVCGRPAGK